MVIQVTEKMKVKEGASLLDLHLLNVYAASLRAFKQYRKYKLFLPLRMG